MRTARAAIAGASVTLAAWVFAAGCSSKTTPGTELGDVGNNASSGSGGGATSGSSGGSTAGGSPSAPSADYSDGGISCGPQGACAPSEQCCYAAPAAPAAPQAREGGLPGLGGGFGAMGGGSTTTCTPAGSCYRILALVFEPAALRAEDKSAASRSSSPKPARGRADPGAASRGSLRR